jgi:hypothetical protein
MSRGNEYFFPKPVNLDELLAKLQPYGIKAALWEDGDTHVLKHVALYMGSLEAKPRSERFLLILDDDPDRIFILDDCMKMQENMPTTIMNAIRDVMGEFFSAGDLPERLEQARQANDREAVAWLRYLDEWEHTGPHWTTTPPVMRNWRQVEQDELRCKGGNE